jgi:hypothetical protein
MKISTLMAACVAALALAGCNRGGPANNQTLMPPPANGATGLPTPGPRPGPTTEADGTKSLPMDAQGVVNTCISQADQARPIAQFDANQRRQIVSCLNAEAARQLNPQLPVQVDALTRLDRISTDGPLLTYHYSVSRSVAQLPAGIGAQLASNTRTTVCGRPDMRQTLELGGSYAYRWTDSAGAVIQEVRIDAC